jgi:ribA/ribD-fused uncharacterized protein
VTGETIASFTGQHRFLSNFFPARVILDGEAYASIEHAYQAAKTTDAAARAPFREPKLTPGAAKRLGRRVLLRTDWESVKFDVMKDLVRQKFAVPELRDRLMATGSASLIEGNTWGDRIWGMVEKDGELVGANHLGRILMEVRAE